MVIGGNNVKIIRRCFIDTGLLTLANIAKYLWQVKDFASDLLVLCLTLAETVMMVMSLPTRDTSSSDAICATLFLMRTHFFSVNCTDAKSNPKTRVFYCGAI